MAFADSCGPQRALLQQLSSPVTSRLEFWVSTHTDLIIPLDDTLTHEPQWNLSITFLL